MQACIGLAFYVCFGVVGGLLGSRLRFPGSVLIGAMLSVIIAKQALKVTWELPKEYGFILYVLVGITVGASFKSEMLHLLPKIAIPVALSTFTLVGMGLLLAVIFAKLGILDRSTAYIATSPGAMSTLIALALDSEATTLIVICFHFFRLLFIILTAPFILKYVLH